MEQKDAGTFPTTHWSRVLRARDADPAQRARALEELLAIYWRPIYSFLRRKGLSIEDAADAVQEFTVTLLQHDLLSRADASRGRFRTFLLVMAQRSLNDIRDREAAQKRGGGRHRIPLDVADAELSLAKSPSGTHEDAYRQAWARTVLETALARLKIDLDSAGRGVWFEILRKFYGVDAGPGGVPYERIAEELGVSASDVANWLHRSRRKLREIVLDEVRRTVASEQDLVDELRELFEGWESIR